MIMMHLDHVAHLVLAASSRRAVHCSALPFHDDRERQTRRLQWIIQATLECM
jgi:hypothetical protein